MSRWVNADELTSTLKYDKEALSDFSKEWHNGLSYAISHISSAKNIDIVKCKDCKYYIDFISEQFINIPTLCGRLSTLDNYVAIKADDFCSYGERTK